MRIDIAKRLFAGFATVAVVCMSGGHANSIDLKRSVRLAIEANPEIGAAVANREAIEFERDQAIGLFLPSVDFEGRSGAQHLDSPTIRNSRSGVDTQFRNEANLVVSQLLFDGFESQGELEHQAARIDGASHRVFERSEFISLNVARQYLEVGRLLYIIEIARDNTSYHRDILANIERGTQQGALSVADRQQAEERLFAAEARVIEFTEELNLARIRFRSLVGEPLGTFRDPGRVNWALPSSLNQALGAARSNNPLIRIATADIDAAQALIKKAESEFYPTVNLELRGRGGDDLEGIEGSEHELRAEVVASWNLYRGGIDSANKQEQLRRVDEQRFRLHKAHRDVEEAVRLSWERRDQQRRRLAQLESQLDAVNELIGSYTQQFKVGKRSLLDLLDTQNTRFNTRVAVETARVAYYFSEYRVAAAMGILLQTLQQNPPAQADAYAREAAGSPPTPDAETMKRWHTRVTRY